MLDGQVSELFSIFEIILQEVEERDVVGSHGHHDLVLLLEALEALNGLLDLFVLDEVDALGNLHFTLYLGKVGCLEGFTGVVVSLNDILIDEWSNEFGR